MRKASFCFGSALGAAPVPGEASGATFAVAVALGVPTVAGASTGGVGGLSDMLCTSLRRKELWLEKVHGSSRGRRGSAAEMAERG